MSDRELIAALRRLKVETGSLVCVGCGYEHNCGIHGCHILRETITRLEQKLTETEMDHEAAELLSRLCRDCDLDRLEELAEADKDGRVVVLPCKVGDAVWITGSVRRLYSEKVRTFFCGNPSYDRGATDNSVQMIRTTGCDIPIHEFGKTVFLTREEAEKALEAVKDD